MSDSAELHRICRDLGGRPHDWGARTITARHAGKMSRSSAAEAFNCDEGESGDRWEDLRDKNKNVEVYGADLSVSKTNTPVRLEDFPRGEPEG